MRNENERVEYRTKSNVHDGCEAISERRQRTGDANTKTMSVFLPRRQRNKFPTVPIKNSEMQLDELGKAYHRSRKIFDGLVKSRKSLLSVLGKVKDNVSFYCVLL